MLDAHYPKEACLNLKRSFLFEHDKITQNSILLWGGSVQFMHLFYVIVSRLLICVIIIYLCFGFIPYSLSKLHGDYPGPKEIYSNSNNVESGHDFLLIHGASLDARVWNNVLQHNIDKSMVAISLSEHEDGVTRANQVNAGNDLITYLKTHKINKTIVGHSTASLWIADAYYKCPECFKDLKIILLAPSFGDNINHGDLQTLKSLNKISFLLPEPMLNLGNVSACEGGAIKDAYTNCKKTYTYGRLFLFNSLKYYNDLVAYSLATDTMHRLGYFLQNDYKNIVIYVSGNDHVLDHDLTIKTAQKYGIKYEVLSNLSHVGLIDDYPSWL